NGFLGKFADAERQCAREFAIEVNRATAHAGNDAGVFRLLAVKPNKDDVALGAVHVLEYAEDLDLHGFRLGALEHAVADAARAGVNLSDWDDRGGFGRLRGGCIRGESQESEQRIGGEREDHFSHQIALESPANKRLVADSNFRLRTIASSCREET